MKNILIIFTLLLTPFFVLAEYNGDHIEFTIELLDGSEIHGYSYLASVFRKDKTLSYQEYLEQNYEIVLKNHHADEVGEWVYFEKRVKYEYESEYIGKSFIFSLLNKKGIDKSAIRSLKIIEMIDYTYAMGVDSYDGWDDTTWMKQKPMETFMTGGLFCSHNIFIHEKNAVTDEVVAGLKKVAIDFDKELKRLQEEMSVSDGEDHYKAEEQVEKLEEGLDDKVDEQMGKFDRQKVVVVTMCTC